MIVLEHFKEYKDAYGVLAMVGSAAWALFLFTTLNSKKLSELDVKKKQIDLDIQAVVNISFEYSITYINDQRLLSLAVLLNNSGSEGELLKLNKGPCSITKIDDYNQDDNKALFGRPAKLNPALPSKSRDSTGAKSIGTLYLRKGMNARLSFLVSLKQDGHYFVDFKVPMNRIDLYKERDDQDDKSVHPVWSHSEIIVIEGDSVIAK